MIFLFCYATGSNAKNSKQQEKRGIYSQRRINLPDSLIVNQKDTIVVLMDTVIENKTNNTTNFYKKLKENAYKHKLTKELHKLLFTSDGGKKSEKSMEAQRSDLPFLPFQGRTIRNIYVRVLKPFGPKLTDTSRVARNWIERTANTLHNTSRVKSILKVIHLKKGEKIDALNIADNERLVRELTYVDDALIKIIPVKGSNNMVDIQLWVKDKFSWGGNVNFSSLSKTSIEVYSKNLYGVGHQLNNEISLNTKEEQQFGYKATYTIPNIASTHINATLNYSNIYDKHSSGISLNKLFETYTTKSAGGATYNHTTRSKTLTEIDPIKNDYFLSFDYWNTWYARGYPIKSPRQYARRKIFVASKIENYNFFDRPTTDSIKNKFFHNRTLFLTSLSINQTQYYKSNLIYNYGRVEDVPYGFLAQLNFGYEKGEFRDRFYSSLSFEIACHVKKTRSYLYNKLAIGSFFNRNGFEQGVLFAQSKFISRIRKWGKFRFRHFGELRYTWGFNRYPEEFVTLNNSVGITDFNSKLVKGTHKLVLHLETVAFTPYRWLDFKFAFFSFADIGVINALNSSQRHPFYCLGLGARIHNNSLVFKTLEIKFAFYPRIPADFRHFAFSASGESRPKFDQFKVKEPEVIPFR